MFSDKLQQPHKLFEQNNKFLNQFIEVVETRRPPFSRRQCSIIKRIVLFS